MNFSIKRTLSQTQGETVLRAARAVYLMAAIASLVIIVVGLIFVLFFQLRTWQSASEIPLPRVYSPSSPILSADDIGKFLTPPQNIRFIPAMSSIHAPLSNRSRLGHFTADTPNGLASYPIDFDILGGKDAALFDRVRSAGKRSGLKPTKALISKVNGLLHTLRKPESATYELEVIARDRFGNMSKPEAISFSLTYVPPSEKSKTSATLPTRMKSAKKITELQQLAKNIAFLVDPKRTPAYFAAYRRAQAVPKKCGVSSNNTTFISDFRRLFDQLRPKLRATNMEAFYTGVCSEWHRALSEQQAAQERAREARASVIAQNEAANAEAEGGRMLAAAGRDIALTVVGAALSAFLLISFLLAFLAIENHTRAVRRAVETLTKNSSNQGSRGAENGASS
ncbi:MAG TPA: hypothetical protein ENI68_03990 [Gammaproteobacteria bacterium]|nr:hypothetical protein [Gammaproteobacteria bacterium]